MLSRAAPLLLSTFLVLACAPAAHAKAPARATLTSCERATAAADDGAATFEGRMEARPGTARMQLKFRLQGIGPDRPRWTALAAPGFDSWQTAARGTTTYVYTKRVEALLAPAGYRVVVRFRWLDAGGARIAGARAASATCTLPDPRPNLTVRALRLAEPGEEPGMRRYVALVRNVSPRPAPATTLLLSVGGVVGTPVAVPALAPRRAVEVQVAGPDCAAGDELLAEVDPDDAVLERADDDNAFARPCPIYTTFHHED